MLFVHSILLQNMMKKKNNNNIVQACRYFPTAFFKLWIFCEFD